MRAPPPSVEDPPPRPAAPPTQARSVAVAAAAQTEKFAALTEGVITTTVKEGAGSGQVWAEGTKIYWDDSAKKFTVTSTSNTLCGYAVAASLTAATTGTLMLQQLGG